MKKIITFFLQEMKPYKLWYILVFQTLFTMPLFFVMHNYSVKLILDAITESDILIASNFYLPVFLYIFSEVYLTLIWRLNDLGRMNALPQTANAVYLKVYEYTINHSYKYFTEKISGTIVSKITGIVRGFEAMISIIQQRVGGPFVALIISIISITLFSPYFGIFLIFWIVLFMSIILPLTKRMNHFSFEENEAKHTLNGKMADTISNIFNLFAFSKKQYEYNELKNEMDTNILPKQKSVIRYNIIFQLTGSFLYILLLFALVLNVIYLRYKGVISIGDIYFIMGMTWGIVDNCWRIAQETLAMMQTVGDLKSSFSLIFEANEEDKFKDKKIKILNPEIQFKNISFNYSDKKKIFKNLNLTIKAGEKVGLVGVSGAGKSTIVKMLLRYIDASGGSILIDGKNIYEFSKDSLREYIAIIPQDILLFNRTILQNIKYARQSATTKEVQEACKRANIHDFIMKLEDGYNTLVGERGVKLSGGQRQRVGIARAILKNSKILILDEATSSLDSESETLIQASINDLLDKNITVIAIAHRFATLKHMDRIIVLEHGIVAQEGIHDDLMMQKNGLYKKLWDMQKI